MRICVINNVLHDEATLPAAQAMVEACGRGVLRDSTRIAIRGLKHAPDTAQTAPDCYRDSYFQLLSTVGIVEAAMAAAQEGFDALIVNCFDDYGVEQARSVVDVPVIGIGGASLFFAAQLARRIGVIVPNLPGQIAFAERQIADLGLSQFLIHDGIRMDELPFAESWCQALGDPDVATRRFEPLVRALLKDGAGAVVFGCGGFSLVCGAQGFTSLEVGGQRYPVVIPITVALLQAEMLVTLSRAQGLPVHARTRGSVLQTRAQIAKLKQDFGH